MLNRKNPISRVAGFTVIELMISIAVLAILLSLGLPSFRTMMMNIEIRNATSSIVTGIQRARAEAVSRNATTSFILSTDSAWTVNVVSPASVVESRPASDGSQSVTRTVLPTGATTISFNSLGVITPNGDGTATLTQVDLAASGGTQNLRVTIGVGGNARMCDPNLPTGSNTNAC